MANEISVSVSLSASKGGATGSGLGSITITMAGDQMLTNVQTVAPGAAEAVFLGDVSTIGYVFIKNLSSVDPLDVDGVETMDSFKQTLLAGEFILIKPVSTAIWLEATAGTVNALVFAIEL